MRKSCYSKMLQCMCCVLSNPSGSESRTRARKSKQAAREQGHHHEGIWGTAAYFFSFSFFKFSDWSTSVRLHVVLLCPSQPDDLIFLRINLCVDTFTIKELNLRWKSEAGIVENIESIVEEYRNTRQLLVSPHYLSANTQQLFLSYHYHCLFLHTWLSYSQSGSAWSDHQRWANPLLRRGCAVITKYTTSRSKTSLMKSLHSW